MARWQVLIFWAFVVFISLGTICNAATPTSFCKCTCFSNSTIIPLDGEPATTTPVNAGKPANPGRQKDVKKGHGTCLDCNKKFCLAYNLPICKDAKEEDVFTTCFQRDSAKDEAVVFIFIIATVGLLFYAAVRPWIEKWRDNIRERRSYAPISTASAEES